MKIVSLRFVSIKNIPFLTFQCFALISCLCQSSTLKNISKFIEIKDLIFKNRREIILKGKF